MLLAQLAQRTAEATGKLRVSMTQLSHEYLHECLESTRKVRVIEVRGHIGMSKREHLFAKT